LEPITAGRAAVTPGAGVAEILSAGEAATYLDDPGTTRAPPGMAAAAPWHKAGCGDHLDGQERKKWKMVNVAARAASDSYGSRISVRVRIVRFRRRRGGIRPLVRRTFRPQQPQRGIRPRRCVKYLQIALNAAGFREKRLYVYSGNECSVPFIPTASSGPSGRRNNAGEIAGIAARIK